MLGIYDITTDPDKSVILVGWDICPDCGQTHMNPHHWDCSVNWD